MSGAAGLIGRGPTPLTDAPKSRPRQAPEAAAELMAKAQEAVSHSDPVGMLEALYASHYLDGLFRRLQAQWPRLPRADVEDCIAEAVNAAFETVSTGRQVSQLGAWLWKSAHNLANDRWRKEQEGRRAVEDLPEEVCDAPLGDDDRRHQDALADHRRVEAIRLARRLLPRIGHGQVVDVMEIVIQTVEAGVPDLPAETVAETLGITTAAARALMSRGLDRLRRVARAEGIEFPDELPGDDDEEEELSPELLAATSEEAE